MNLPSLSRVSKIVSGIFLIGATIFGVVTIFAYFPNKMPPPGKGDDAWYSGERYKMTLLEGKDTASKKIDSTILKLKKKDTEIAARLKKYKLPNDSAQITKDSTEKAKITDSLAKLEQTTAQNNTSESTPELHKDHRPIHLNTILLILVAIMGFLGNMIHVASSFTSYIGNGTFEPRWILWYFVKPFTAAGLAVIVYFVIRAGFLGAGADPASINLYGILAMSALAGLFTDNAALKLKEVFDVIFKPKDERSDRLTDFKVKITTITPPKIDVNNPNAIEINGENFDKKKITVKINGKAIAKPTISKDSIEFTYSVDAADRTKTSFEITLTDDKGNELDKKTLPA
jgi:hypothetical protein